MDHREPSASAAGLNTAVRLVDLVWRQGAVALHALLGRTILPLSPAEERLPERGRLFRHVGERHSTDPADTVNSGSGVGSAHHYASHPRTYTSIAQARSDGNNARVWGGMHYPSTVEISDPIGEAIAKYVNEHSMKHLGPWR